MIEGRHVNWCRVLVVWGAVLRMSDLRLQARSAHLQKLHQRCVTGAAGQVRGVPSLPPVLGLLPGGRGGRATQAQPCVPSPWRPQLPALRPGLGGACKPSSSRQSRPNHPPTFCMHFSGTMLWRSRSSSHQKKWMKPFPRAWHFQDRDQKLWAAGRRRDATSRRHCCLWLGQLGRGQYPGEHQVC